MIGSRERSAQSATASNSILLLLSSRQEETICNIIELDDAKVNGGLAKEQFTLVVPEGYRAGT